MCLPEKERRMSRTLERLVSPFSDAAAAPAVDRPPPPPSFLDCYKLLQRDSNVRFNYIIQGNILDSSDFFLYLTSHDSHILTIIAVTIVMPLIQVNHDKVVLFLNGVDQQGSQDITQHVPLPALAALGARAAPHHPGDHLHHPLRPGTQSKL